MKFIGVSSQEEQQIDYANAQIATLIYNKLNSDYPEHIGGEGLTHGPLNEKASQVQIVRGWTWQVVPMELLVIDTCIFKKNMHHRKRY